ncbi:MAG: sugar-binding transcriptional regulator [Chloroflexota bacterium]
MSMKTSQIIRAAELYYERNLSQQEVAKILGTSRTSVSRLLADARENGVVEITINRPVAKHPKLSERLRQHFNLRDAVVVDSSAEYKTTLRNVGEAAAELLLSILDNDCTIGISWGRTLYHMVDALSETTTSGVEVIQMLGSLGQGNPQIDGPDLARRMAEKVNGRYRYVHAPAVVENSDLRDQLMQQPQIRQTLEQMAHADICLLSVGALADDKSSLQRTGYLTALEREQYLEQGAVGHLLAKMIDINGNEIERYNRRVVAIPFGYLQRAEWSIGVSASAMKSATILGAIRGNYINTLVIDDDGANQLLRLVEE